MEDAQLGLIAPLLQEVLKGAPVLLVALRCRGGFAFVMTRSLIDLVSAFAFHESLGRGLGARAEWLLYSLLTPIAQGRGFSRCPCTSARGSARPS